MSKNVTYNLVKENGVSKQNRAEYVSNCYLLNDFDRKQEIKLDDINYLEDDNYMYECDVHNIDIARDGADYIVDGFKLTYDMIDVMFETLKTMCTVSLFDDDSYAADYLDKKYNELGTLGFARFLLNFGDINLVLCWDEWFDFEYIKENKKAFGLSDYNISVFNANKLDEYHLDLDGNICYDIRIRGCGDVEEFIDKAYHSLRRLTDVLLALEYHKNKAVA